MLYISQYSEADCRRFLRQNLKRYAINDVYARVGKRGFLMRKNVARIDRNYRIPVEKTLLARFCGEREGKAVVSLRIWNGYLWPQLALFGVLTFGILWGASHRFMQA